VSRFFIVMLGVIMLNAVAPNKAATLDMAKITLLSDCVLQYNHIFLKRSIKLFSLLIGDPSKNTL
jgi:hypothetical protein